jgi:hypothetical protein
LTSLSPRGPYAISAALSPAAVLSNYNITCNTALFTITPTPLTILGNDGTKVYGAMDVNMAPLAGDSIKPEPVFSALTFNRCRLVQVRLQVEHALAS